MSALLSNSKNVHLCESTCVTRSGEEDAKNGVQALIPQGETSGWPGMCLAQTWDLSPMFSGQISTGHLEEPPHYQELWNEPGFDEASDRRLNHVTSQVLVGSSFLFSFPTVTARTCILGLWLRIPIVWDAVCAGPAEQHTHTHMRVWIQLTRTTHHSSCNDGEFPPGSATADGCQRDGRDSWVLHSGNQAASAASPRTTYKMIYSAGFALAGNYRARPGWNIWKTSNYKSVG